MAVEEDGRAADAEGEVENEVSAIMVEPKGERDMWRIAAS